MTLAELNVQCWLIQPYKFERILVDQLRVLFKRLFFKESSLCSKSCFTGKYVSLFLKDWKAALLYLFIYLLVPSPRISHGALVASTKVLQNHWTCFLSFSSNFSHLHLKNNPTGIHSHCFLGQCTAFQINMTFIWIITSVLINLSHHWDFCPAHRKGRYIKNHYFHRSLQERVQVSIHHTSTIYVKSAHLILRLFSFIIT